MQEEKDIREGIQLFPLCSITDDVTPLSSPSVSPTLGGVWAFHPSSTHHDAGVIAVLAHEGILRVFKAPVHPYAVPVLIAARNAQADITCILWTEINRKLYLLAGYNDGKITCFDINLQEVFTEVFHPSAVIKIRLNAFVSGNGFRAIHEDLVVIYDGAIAVYMEGNDLIDIIQKESARLRLIKWDLNLETLLDICIYEASNISNPLRDMRKLQILAVGSNPFISKAVSDETAFYANVVRLGYKVAEKVTKAVFGLAKGFIFGNNRQDNSEEKNRLPSPRLTTPTRLAQKAYLSDPSRIAKSISMSPSRSLAVLSDNFGRIFLLDVEMFVLIRQWKGYRDAQVGWVTDSKKRGNFLVIYAPARGLLEIWKCPNGVRVGARNLGECNSHGLHCSISIDSDGKRVAKTYLIRLADGFTRDIDIT